MTKMKYESPKMEVVYFENGAIDTTETSWTPGDNETDFDPA